VNLGLDITTTTETPTHSLTSLTSEFRDDMNTDIDKSDCIIVETEGSGVRKRSAGLAGSRDPAGAGASAPSSEPGKVALEDRRG
jgi:hypothetical protein